MQRLSMLLTVINCGLLVLLLTQLQAVEAESIAPVLRGRALEIVDAQGKVRASILVQTPPERYKLPDGSPYPESVTLRLIDPSGGPHVKLSSSVRGAGLVLGSGVNKSYLQLGAMGPEPALTFSDKDGRQKVIRQ